MVEKINIEMDNFFDLIIIFRGIYYIEFLVYVYENDMYVFTEDMIFE